MNIADSALSRGNPGNPALVWAEEETPTELQHMTVPSLRQECMKLAALLQTMGIKAGALVHSYI